MTNRRSVTARRAFTRWCAKRRVQGSRSTRRTASIAKLAISRTRRRTSTGSRLRAVAVLTTLICEETDLRLRQFLFVTAAAISLSACSSLGIDMGSSSPAAKGSNLPSNASLNSGGALQTNDPTGAPPVRVNSALDESYGNYLNARLAASQHDMENAAKFYLASLDADPNNPDLLARAFLYSVSAGDMVRAPKLAAQVVRSEEHTSELQSHVN